MSSRHPIDFLNFGTMLITIKLQMEAHIGNLVMAY